MKMTTVFALVSLALLAGCASSAKSASEPDDVLVLKTEVEESEKTIKRQEALIKDQKKARKDCEEEIDDLEAKIAALEAENAKLEKKAEAAIVAVKETEAMLYGLYEDAPAEGEEYYGEDDEEEYEDTEVYESDYGSTVVEKKSYKSETYVYPYPGASAKPAKPKPPLPEKRIFVEGYVDSPKFGSKINVKISAEKVHKNTFFRLWVGKYEVAGDGFGDMTYMVMPSGKEIIATVIKPGEVIYVPVMKHGPHSVYVQECNMTFDPVSGTEVCVANSDDKRLVDTIKDATKSAVFLMYYD